MTGMFKPSSPNAIIENAGNHVDFCSFDSEYLERLLARDREIERHFHAYFSELILIKLRARQYSQYAIEDICHETCLRVFQAIRRGGIRDAQRIGAFVNSVCNHVMLDYGKAGASSGLPGGAGPDPAGERADGESARMARQEQAEVRSILAKMSDQNRQLLSAVFLEERSSELICRQFGVDQNDLRGLLFRARTQFRKILEKQQRARKLPENETDLY